jgi:hypothetical protein
VRQLAAGGLPRGHLVAGLRLICLLTSVLAVLGARKVHPVETAAITSFSSPDVSSREMLRRYAEERICLAALA